MASSLGFALLSSPAWALAGTIYIDQPLPERFASHWRDFLEGLWIAHIEAALSATKTVAPIPDDAEHFIFRVEHAETCLGERCLTVLGRIDPKGLMPQVIFLAHGAYVQGDAIEKIWGTASAAMLFPSGDGMLTIWRSAQGWLVLPSKSNLPPDIYARRPDPPPVSFPPQPKQYPPGFEGFRQALEELKARADIDAK